MGTQKTCRVFLLSQIVCCFAALELIQSVAHLYRSTYLDYYIIFPYHIQKRGKVEKKGLGNICCDEIAFLYIK